MASLYHPTPLEVAYGNYLLHQQFGLFVPICNPIRISGRQAVQFLTTSGVDRMILRNLWSVADPTNVGSLTDLSQFYVLLRLVAMAQFGMLHANSSCENMVAELQQCASQPLALPAFSIVGIVPSADELTATYLVGTEAFNQVPLRTLSIDDAFESIVSVQDAPLPMYNHNNQSLPPGESGYVSQEVVQPPPMSSQYMVQPTLSSTPSSDAYLTSQLTQSAMFPTGSMGSFDGGPTPDYTNQPAVHSTGFGGGGLYMTSSTSVASTASTTLSIAPATLPVSDAFGVMPSFQNGPLPSLGTEYQDRMVGSQNDEFGGFEQPAPPVSTSYIAPSSSFPSDDDPFGAIAEVQDAPLPTLGAVGGGVYQDVVLDGNASGMDDNDFGEFEAVPAPPQMPAPSAAPESDGNGSGMDDNDFGEFEAVPAPHQMPTPSAAPESDDPFGSVADVQDAPLPSLSGLQGSDDGTDDDDFGGFESVPNPDLVPIPSTAPESDDPFGAMVGVQDAPLPSLSAWQGSGSGDEGNDDDEFGGFESTPAQAPTPSILPESDDPFGAMTKVQDAPLPSLGALQSVASGDAGNNEDEFGGFESVTGSEQVPVPSTLPESDDPFGAMTKVQDAPLPSLGALQSVTSGDDGNDEDEFGGFASVTGTEQVPVPSTLPESNDPFGAMVAVQDAPLPSFGALQRGTSGDDGIDEDEFGGFESVVGSEQAPALSIVPEPDDPFSAMAGVQDAPLPSLGAWQANSSGDDEFGGFESVPDQILTSPVASPDDPFGAMTGVQDSPLPSFNAATTGGLDVAEGTVEDSEAFGDFGTTPSIVPESEDPFGAVSGAYDAPLPSLSAIATEYQGSAQTSGEGDNGDDDDDFGDFNDASEAEKQISNEADFNAFGSFSASPESNVARGYNPEFGGFNATESEKPQNSEEEFDAFGAFRADPHSNILDGDNDNFGAFDGPTGESPNKSEEDFDAFGGFNETPTMPDNDEMFGAFDGPTEVGHSDYTSAPVSTGMQPITHDAPEGFDDDFGDFGNFEQAPVTFQSTQNESSNTIAVLRQKIQSLSLQLPEPLRRQTGLSGKHVDLGECFEANIGVDSLIDEGRRKRAERCVQLLELLSSSHTKLGSTYWEQCLLVAKDELVVGVSVLQRAKKLSSKQMESVREPMQTMIHGLAEFVRVSRSIVASIGDLLMLEASVRLTVDTWASTWFSMSLLEKAIEVETLWKEIERGGSDLDMLGSAITQDIQLGKIREKCADSSSSTQLCQLTLQPLTPDDSGTTKAGVLWKNRSFMACSANFLAHRCPFYD